MMRPNYLDKEQAAIEAIQEAVLEHPEAVRIVIDNAKQWLAHWEIENGPITSPNLRDELLCQYQSTAWKDLFKAISL